MPLRAHAILAPADSDIQLRVWVDVLSAMDTTPISTAQTYITVLSPSFKLKFDRITPRSKHRRIPPIISTIPNRIINKTSLAGNIFATHLHNRGVFPRSKHAFFSSCQIFSRFSVKILVLFSSFMGSKSNCSRGRELPVLKSSLIQRKNKRYHTLVSSRFRGTEVSRWGSLTYPFLTGIIYKKSDNSYRWEV